MRGLEVALQGLCSAAAVPLGLQFFAAVLLWAKLVNSKVTVNIEVPY